MFWFDGITFIDLTVTVGIIVVHDAISFFVDIFTIPGVFTIWTFIWVITPEIFVFWTVGISPFIFTSDHTVVDFTPIKRLVIISVAHRKDEI